MRLKATFSPSARTIWEDKDKRDNLPSKDGLFRVKKEFVITEIRAASDGSPFVFVTLKSPSEVGGPQRSRPPSGVSMASFSSLEDALKNLGPAISRQMFGGFATVIKLGLDEYEKLDIKVGDRISIDIQKIRVGIS